MSALLPHDYRSRAPIERLILHLWRCGPRAVAEFLDEIAVEHGIGPEIVTKLAEYGRLDAGTLRALGGDRFPQPPLRAVGGGR